MSLISTHKLAMKTLRKMREIPNIKSGKNKQKMEKSRFFQFVVKTIKKMREKSKIFFILEQTIGPGIYRGDHNYMKSNVIYI